MNPDEYKHKLENALKKYVQEYLTRQGSISIRNHTIIIVNVENVSIQANIDLKLSKLLSGDELEIDVNGTVSFFEPVTNGSRSRRVSFWIKPAQVKFDRASDDFHVIHIDEFLGISALSPSYGL